MARSASICSVTCMDASSAAMLAPIRAIITMAVSSGPSSVMTLAASTLPITQSGNPPVNCAPLCCEVTAPPSIAMNNTRGSD